MLRIPQKLFVEHKSLCSGSEFHRPPQGMTCCEYLSFLNHIELDSLASGLRGVILEFETLSLTQIT